MEKKLLKIILLLTISLSANSQNRDLEFFNFDSIKVVKVKIISNCRIDITKHGKDWNKLEIQNSNIRSVFEDPITLDDTLILKELQTGNSSSADTKTPEYLFKVTCPQDCHIMVSGGSCDLHIENTEIMLSANLGIINAYLINIKGKINLISGMSTINILNTDARVNISTGSGNINVKNSLGQFNLASSNGTIKCEEISITSPSSISTNKGSSLIYLKSTPLHNLTVSSTTGKALIDYKRNLKIGEINLICSEKKGIIQTPFSKTSHSIFRSMPMNKSLDENENQPENYIKESFIAGGRSPLITVRTYNGRAVIK